MTPQELESLILKTKDPRKLPAAFSNLTEKERRSLSTFTSKLKTQLGRGKANKDASSQLKSYLKKDVEHYYSDAFTNACISLFAMCPVSTLKKTEIFIGWSNRSVLIDIIIDRKPDWIDDFIEHDMDQEFGTFNFDMVRRLIREGICQKPKANGYIEKFAWELMSTENDKKKPPKPPLSERLLAEPDMLEDVWRLFEIENQAFNTESWLTYNAPDNYENWPDALIKLSQQGHVERERLLDASLSGLLLDIKQNQLSGFHKFHKRLLPVKEELANRQVEYLALLSHNVGHVIKFTLAMISQLEKNSLLDSAGFLAEVSSVFMHEAKGNAISALKLIDRIVKKDPSHSEAALDAIIEGLKHVNPDVQTLAVQLMQTHQSLMIDKHYETITDSFDFLSAAVKQQARDFLNQHGLVDEDVNLVEVSDEEFNQQLAALSKEEKNILGLDNPAILEMKTGFLPPVEKNVLKQRVLPGQEKLSPINDLDELIHEVSHAVEVVDSPDHIDQVIDGISRLCDQRPQDFSTKVAPLLNRLENGMGGSEGLVDSYGNLRLALADLLFTWLTGDYYSSTGNEYSSDSFPEQPSITLVRDLTKRVAKQQAQPLIAAATHRGGWIDPLVWIERIIYYEKHNISFDRMDFCLSMLRLAPDNRDQARKLLHALNNETRPLVDFVLGGDSQPGYDDREEYELWISAARARDAHANWAELFAPMELNDSWPGSVYPAIYEWRSYTKKTEHYSFPKIDIQISSDAQEQEETESKSGISQAMNKLGNIMKGKIATKWERIPTAAFNQRSVLKNSWDDQITVTWITQWLEQTWPLNPEPIYLLGVKQMAFRIDEDSSNWEPSHGFFHGLFEKKRAWGEAAHLMLSIGLLGKDADCRGLAIDALIEGIETGKADINLLSDVLGRLSEGGWLKLNRLSENLLQVAQVSSVHSWAVSELIQQWICLSNVKQHNFFKILEVLYEVQSVTRQSLHNVTLDALKELKGSTKAAKLAKQLRDIDNSDAVLMKEIRKQAISLRISSFK